MESSLIEMCLGEKAEVLLEPAATVRSLARR